MKKLLATLLSLTMVLSLAACGNNSNNQPTTTAAPTTAASETPTTQKPETTPAAAENVTLNVAYMANYASLWSVLTGIDQGYFEEEGLNVELWEFSDGPAEIAAMESGSIDACAAWSPYTLEIYKQVEDAIEIEFSNDSVNLASWVCMPNYAENNHDTLVRFCRALYKAMDYASKPENYEYVAQLVAKQTGTSLESSMNQTGDADWFDIATLKEIVADGTLKGYYEHLEADFVKDGTIQESDVVEVEKFVMLDLIKEVLDSIQ